MEGDGDFGATFWVKTGQFTWPYVASQFFMGYLILDPGLMQWTIYDLYWFPTKCSDFQIVAIFMKPTVQIIILKCA